jgi:transposase-like protein
MSDRAQRRHSEELKQRIVADVEAGRLALREAGRLSLREAARQRFCGRFQLRG